MKWLLLLIVFMVGCSEEVVNDNLSLFERAIEVNGTDNYVKYISETEQVDILPDGTVRSVSKWDAIWSPRQLMKRQPDMGEFNNPTTWATAPYVDVMPEVSMAGVIPDVPEMVVDNTWTAAEVTFFIFAVSALMGIVAVVYKYVDNKGGN